MTKAWTLDYRLDRPPPLEVRFWAKVQKGDDCWIWSASKVAGYGQFWNGERLVLAHRWLWELENGSVPDGLELDHLCRSRACVRPGHLELVTRKENLNRSPLLAAYRSRGYCQETCKRGHSLADAYVTPAGRRQCGECQRARDRASKERRKERG